MASASILLLKDKYVQIHNYFTQNYIGTMTEGS